MSSLEVTDITLHLLENVTNQFSEDFKIGTGGYGEVYKGVLNGCEIAVKKLYLMNGLDDTSFTNEFRQLMKVQHKNIIRLLAYCYEIRHKHIDHGGQLVWSQVIDRALCFEYMQGGSLAKHISDESCMHDWPTTYKIIKGTCEGLNYLHKGRGEGDYIYHLDLKPDNILLDKELNPKIADFGLSRLFGLSKTHEANSRMKGTLGFMPQEYIHKGAISPKNDVFSLGVIIFYLLAGRKGYDDYYDSPSLRKEFIESVQKYWKKKMRATADYTWDDTDHLGVKTCIEIAMRCVEFDRKNRPTTKDIIEELKKLDDQIVKMSKKDQRPLTGQRTLDCSYIAVDPSRELLFKFKPKRDIESCLQLINNRVECFIAFNIKTDKNKYCAEPTKGILRPSSKCYITVTLRAQDKAPQDMQCLDKFVVQGRRVNEDFTPEQITRDFLKKATEVYEVILPIVYIV